MSDDSPPVYQDNDYIVYRASSIGGCLVALAAARQGLDKQEFSGESKQGKIFEAGNEAEDEFFTIYPHLAHFRQFELALHVTKKILVRAHADAIVDHKLIEVKSQSPKEFDSWSWESWTEDPLWVKYSWQISTMMAAYGYGAGLALYRINRESKEIDHLEIVKPFWDVEQIFERILKVEELAQEEELKCTESNSFFFCPYPYLHVDEREVVDDEELEELVRQYLWYKALNEEYTKSASNVRAQIETKMNTAGYNKVLLMSGTTITRSEYDTKDHMVKGSHQVRLTIKEPKK